MMIGLVATFIGFIFIICYPINKRKNSHCTEQTQGTLEEIRARYNSDGPIKDMHVYSYFVDGTEYRLETLDHNLDVKEVGDKCTIWYNPAKPKEAQAFHGSDSYLKTLLIIGIVALLLGIVVMCIGFVQQFIL